MNRRKGGHYENRATVYRRVRHRAHPTAPLILVESSITLHFWRLGAQPLTTLDDVTWSHRIYNLRYY